ncbi:gp16 family protein [uncultured Paraglaciecola sp.]|uniref:gp16 family protein n=1 Tax=uncultured Paraglaciecola sp. TaxID=1765024 RepID=UPI00263797F8|nr:regulatory protein GemA [uncultured Paraglaciecola sp.]
MRKALMAKIHIAKKQLNLDDDVYRDVLNHITGQSSCSKMSDNQLKNVLDHFKNKGFKAKPKNGRRMSPNSSEPVKTPQIRKIRAVWITMHLHGIVRDNSEAALDGYVKRMSAQQNNGKGVDAVAWLNGELAHKVLEALKAWHIREALKRLSSIGITHDELGNVLYKQSYNTIIETFAEALSDGKL